MKKQMSLLALAILAPGSAFGFWLNFHDNLARQGLEMYFDDHTLWSTAKYDTGTDLDEADLHDAHFDSESFDTSGDRLELKITKSVDDAAVCNKKSSVTELGKALHGLQDFYAHSSWVDRHCTGQPIPINTNIFNMSRPTSSTKCDLTVGPGTSPTTYTSGYYPDETAPSGKCSHGQLNKDAIFVNVPVYGSPRGATKCQGESLHKWAKGVARDHTEAIYNDIVAYLATAYYWQVDELLSYMTTDQYSVTLVADLSNPMGVGAASQLLDGLAEQVESRNQWGDVTVVGVDAHGPRGLTQACRVAGWEEGAKQLREEAGGGSPREGKVVEGIIQSLENHRGIDPAVVVITTEGAINPAQASKLRRLLRENEANLHVFWLGLGDGGELARLATETGGRVYRGGRGLSLQMDQLIEELDPQWKGVTRVRNPHSPVEFVVGEEDRVRVAARVEGEHLTPITLKVTQVGSGQVWEQTGLAPALEWATTPGTYRVEGVGTGYHLVVLAQGGPHVTLAEVPVDLRDAHDDHGGELPPGDYDLRVGGVDPGSLKIQLMDQAGHLASPSRWYPTDADADPIDRLRVQLVGRGETLIVTGNTPAGLPFQRTLTRLP